MDELEYRAALFDPREYWESTRASSLSALAAAQRAAAESQRGANSSKGRDLIEKKAMARHPHDGLVHCRQITETVDEFLHRLPPSVTKEEDVGPWIRIANRESDAGYSMEKAHEMMEQGQELLDDFSKTLSSLQAGHPTNQTKAALTRKINAERRKLEADLLKIAVEKGVKTGKWMLFPSNDQLDDTWSAVARATAKGTLGAGAKVASYSGRPDRRLICVYTEDFSNKEDVRRVLVKLVEMGLVPSGSEGGSGRPIYYKCDAYTYWDIKGGNPWGIKPSMHSSTDVLARKW